MPARMMNLLESTGTFDDRSQIFHVQNEGAILFVELQTVVMDG